MSDRLALERNIRLHIGDLPPEQLPRSTRRLLTPGPVPLAPLRAAQRLAMKAGRLDWERSWLEPLVAARRAALGAVAAGPPKFLVRVDEFPNHDTFDNPRSFDASRRFHDVMAGAGVAHLMAIVPQLTHAAMTPGSNGGRPLGEREVALIERMVADGVTLAQHGTTHRTRFADPRRRSELGGLDRRDTERLLDEGRRRLVEAGVGRMQIFVPPFNRFDARQYPVLAERFEVVCGGPESVALMGFHGGPLWRGEAVYLPCYAPLYADAATILPAAERLIASQPGTWVPIVLHTSWEQGDQFRALARLAERIAPYAVSWQGLLGEVQRGAGGRA